MSVSADVLPGDTWIFGDSHVSPRCAAEIVQGTAATARNSNTPVEASAEVLRRWPFAHASITNV
jgi:hypothetical protein